MLHWNCAVNGIKTRMGVIGFNKWNGHHFQNGWHWLNETFAVFFFDKTLSKMCLWVKKENRTPKKCESVWDIWRMNHFQVWEHLSPWAGGAESRSDFSLYPSCCQSENILQCRHECRRVMTCERVSDRVTALRQTDWDRGRWGMGESGEEGGR